MSQNQFLKHLSSILAVFFVLCLSVQVGALPTRDHFDSQTEYSEIQYTPKDKFNIDLSLPAPTSDSFSGLEPRCDVAGLPQVKATLGGQTLWLRPLMQGDYTGPTQIWILYGHYAGDASDLTATVAGSNNLLQTRSYHTFEIRVPYNEMLKVVKTKSALNIKHTSNWWHQEVVSLSLLPYALQKTRDNDLYFKGFFHRQETGNQILYQNSGKFRPELAYRSIFTDDDADLQETICGTEITLHLTPETVLYISDTDDPIYIRLKENVSAQSLLHEVFVKFRIYDLQSQAQPPLSHYPFR